MYRSEIKLYNVDCMEYMKTCKDNQFDLAIVDPPYGIGASDYKRGGTKYGNSKAKCKVYSIKDWDKSSPEIVYFNELLRISKNQIIWGSNHFISKMPINSSCWIVWDKDKAVGSGYADCELAWTSFKTAVRRFKFRWAGMLQEDMKNKEIRIHPTQKPVALYKWLLTNYAKPGDKIFDSHLGSGSIAIACDELGYDLTGCEIDKEYYDAALKRLKPYRMQQQLFR